MTALNWITTEAKRLRRQYPRRFKTWREYVGQASAIYASKHKGKSPVGKERPAKRRKVGAAVITRGKTIVSGIRRTRSQAARYGAAKRREREAIKAKKPLPIQWYIVRLSSMAFTKRGGCFYTFPGGRKIVWTVRDAKQAKKYLTENQIKY